MTTIGELWGIETVALRIFNAYGPGQSMPVAHGPVVPRFLRQALSGGSLVIFGDGQQTRDFIYITDVVEALLQAAHLRGVNRQVINIGSGRETSVNELSRLVEDTTGIALKQLYNREKSGGVKRLVADIALARELLQWEPSVSLAEGLARTLADDGRFRFEASSARVG
jgi:UDP-glucose 4-epimerase